MPTIAEIERLTALVGQLLPLRSQAPGQLIQADDWNTLVGVLIEVARAAMSDEEGGALPHDHTDQVRAGWLDPVLRARFERGPLDDPVAVGRVTALEGHLTAVRRDLASLGADLAAALAATARVETSDLTRQAALTQLARKIEGAGNASDDVRDLRGTLDALRADLDRVTAVAGGLEIDGQPVNVSDVARRVGRLDELRDRLTMPTGELLDVAALERRLTELRTTLVTEDELTAALGDVTTRVPDDVADSIVQRALAAAGEEADRRSTALLNEIRAGLEDRLAAIESRAVEAAVARASDAADAIRPSLVDQLRVEIAAGDDAVRTAAQAARDELAAMLRTDVDAGLQAVDATIADAVAAGLDRLGPTLTEALTAKVDALTAELAPLIDRVVAAERAATDAATSVAALEVRTTAARDALAAELQSELASGLQYVRDEALAGDAATADTLRGELARDRQRNDLALGEIRAQLPRLVEDGVRAARDDLLAAVHTEVAGLRPELTRLVETWVSDEVARVGVAGPIARPPIIEQPPG